MNDQSPYTPRQPSRYATVTAVLVPYACAREVAALDLFRIAWEREHGPVDMSKYYSCRWPHREQEQLCKIDFKRYFEALPAFFQDFIRHETALAAKNGALDDMPDHFIRLYLGNKMRGTDDSGTQR